MLRESGDYADGANQGKWDLPGGRVEFGQHFEDSLKREIKEECGLQIEIGEVCFVGEWRPKVRDERWQIFGAFFTCHADTDKIRLSQDHDNYKWISEDDIDGITLIDPTPQAIRKDFDQLKNL